MVIILHYYIYEASIISAAMLDIFTSFDESVGVPGHLRKMTREEPATASPPFFLISSIQKDTYMDIYYMTYFCSYRRHH